MAQVEVEALLQEVSTESPCGDDLEYDLDFGEMERAAQGRPAQQMGDKIKPAKEPDWADVENRATQLLSRTKDLRVALYFTRAQLNMRGLVGLSSGLQLLRGLLERYWDGVYPRLDEEDDNDPALRLNSIAALSDPGTLLNTLRDTPLAELRGFGEVRYRDIALIKGELSPAAGAEDKMPDPASINAIFTKCDLETLQETARATNQALEHEAAIKTLLADYVGVDNVPDLKLLRQSLEAIRGVLADKLAQRGAGDATGRTNGSASAEDGMTTQTDAESSGGVQPAAPIGGIKGREDVIRALDRICEYYDRHEPSSPVPLLLRRAKRLVAKNFLDILRDLAPQGVSQVENIGGTGTGDAGTVGADSE